MLKVAGGIILAIIILTVVAPIACGMCVVGGGAVLEEKAKSERKQKKAQIAAKSPVGKSVMYLNKCNVRARPSTRSKIVARALADKAYPVLEDKGQWKKIKIDGTVGWTGCRDKR